MIASKDVRITTGRPANNRTAARRPRLTAAETGDLMTRRANLQIYSAARIQQIGPAESPPVRPMYPRNSKTPEAWASRK
jgi:hypothetical protein